MGSGFEEVLELYERVSDELKVIGRFSDSYRSVVSAFIEQNFPGGPETVHDDLPDEAKMLPRYVGPEKIGLEELERFSEDAAYLANFSRLRGQNLENAQQVIGGVDNYRFFSTGNSSIRGSELRNALERQHSNIKDFEDEIRAVAKFIEPVGLVDFRPAYRIDQLYHTEGAAVADPDDIDFPEEKYWPFDVSIPQDTLQYDV